MKYLIIYTDHRLYFASFDGKFTLQWYLNKDKLKIVNDIFNREFGKKTI